MSPSLTAPVFSFLLPLRGKNKANHACFLFHYFYKSERFLEMNEGDRIVYTSGLMDGFFASVFFGATDETMAVLRSCTQDMDSKQVTAIITKYVKDHPEHWHLALSVEAFEALNTSCPGGLKIVRGKD